MMPNELFDAARLDGASEWKIFFLRGAADCPTDNCSPEHHPFPCFLE